MNNWLTRLLGLSKTDDQNGWFNSINKKSEERKQQIQETQEKKPINIMEKIKSAKDYVTTFAQPVTVYGKGKDYGKTLDVIPDEPEKDVVKPKSDNPYSDVLQNVFGDKAQDFEEVLRWGDLSGGKYGVNYGGENLHYNAKANNTNTDGSLDRGLFQINSNTFNDFMRRKGDLLQSLGINSFEDMYDPYKNALMAKVIYEEQGFNAWYGAPDRLRSQK